MYVIFTQESWLSELKEELRKRCLPSSNNRLCNCYWIQNGIWYLFHLIVGPIAIVSNCMEYVSTGSSHRVFKNHCLTCFSVLKFLLSLAAPYFPLKRKYYKDCAGLSKGVVSSKKWFFGTILIWCSINQ